MRALLRILSGRSAEKTEEKQKPPENVIPMAKQELTEERRREIEEETKNSPFYLLGQIEFVIENERKTYKTAKSQISEIKRLMNDFYSRHGLDPIK